MVYSDFLNGFFSPNKIDIGNHNPGSHGSNFRAELSADSRRTAGDYDNILIK